MRLPASTLVLFWPMFAFSFGLPFVLGLDLDLGLGGVGVRPFGCPFPFPLSLLILGDSDAYGCQAFQELGRVFDLMLFEYVL